MSIQFKPSRGAEETYDNAVRGLRTANQEGHGLLSKEYESILTRLDVKWAKEGEQ